MSHFAKPKSNISHLKIRTCKYANGPVSRSSDTQKPPEQVIHTTRDSTHLDPFGFLVFALWVSQQPKGGANGRNCNSFVVKLTSHRPLKRAHKRDLKILPFYNSYQFIVNLIVLKVLDFASWGAQESLPWSMSRQFQHWPPSKICVFEYSSWRLRRTNWKHADIENETFAAFVVFISDS